MYIAVIVLIIMAAFTIASAAFGIFRVNTSEKHSKVHPVENKYIPAIGGQIAVAYDYPSSDAINDMIARRDGEGRRPGRHFLRGDGASGSSASDFGLDAGVQGRPRGGAGGGGPRVRRAVLHPGAGGARL